MGLAREARRRLLPLPFLLLAAASAVGAYMAEPEPQSRQPAMADILIGARVVRNPHHWLDAYGAQDGGAGSVGTVIELRQWAAGRNVTSDTIAIRVRWDTGDVNAYRWSVSGAVRDLVVVGYRPLRPGDEAPSTHEGLAAYWARQAAGGGVRTALLAVRGATGGAKAWAKLSGWTSEGEGRDPCSSPSWEGVSCVEGRVVGLSLARSGLSGSLHAAAPALCGKEVGAHLESLTLSHNTLTGGLPPALCDCHALRFLDLSHNAFTGPLPPCLGGLLRLETLSLAGNALEGGVPGEWVALARRTGPAAREEEEAARVRSAQAAAVMEGVVREGDPAGVRILHPRGGGVEHSVTGGGARGLSLLHLHNNVGLDGPLPPGLGDSAAEGGTRVTCTGTGLSPCPR